MKEIASDGGPAFPIPEYSGGMSLRDWFAGMAMQGLLAMCAGQNVNPGTPEKAAEVAYEYADAMLRQRAALP